MPRIFIPILYSGPRKLAQDRSADSWDKLWDGHGPGLHLPTSLHKFYFLPWKVWTFYMLQWGVILEKKITDCFGAMTRKRHACDNITGTSSRAYTLCFNLLALGLWIVLALENEWEIAIFCYSSWHQLTTHQLSLLKIVLLLYKSTRFSFHDPCILILETSPSSHPRFLWMKASWWPFHSFCPLL